ncbi:hypothetical protein CUMW_235480 [Citrus unshiu]|uniref:D-isomer specific 2-hydroxyacid dehydrogenase NAD-binding domain-containing protein n=1 Tax=Citrus unshiu TaxID=55188 RepID=A0A2H5QJ97_CITUN|nr:hypothetical protein CUMW_235480 [Citrus unshiu]
MEGMATSSDKSITLVLFRGPHFPASHNYAKGYLQNYPSIKVWILMLLQTVQSKQLESQVFISGFGNIGVELAKLLRPFGVKIIAAKRSWASHSQQKKKDDDDLVDENGCREDIFGFASKADVAGIVSKSLLSSMEKGSLLVNIVRGGLLDYEAVAHYLESGHLGGLGLDVVWTEPFDPNNPILKFQSVLITPHVGGVTEHSYRSTAKVVGDVALQLHAGTPLRGIEPVN